MPSTSSGAAAVAIGQGVAGDGAVVRRSHVDVVEVRPLFAIDLATGNDLRSVLPMGVKRGHVHGASDEWGNAVAAGGVHVHDFHATILQCLGIDHERLVYRFQGRDFRLTDVGGHVVREILS